MCKLFIYLRSSEAELINSFETATLEIVKNLKTEYHIGYIEGSALTEDKFTRVIEVCSDSLLSLNKLMISSEGKNLTRHLSNYMGHITSFIVEFKD